MTRLTRPKITGLSRVCLSSIRPSPQSSGRGLQSIWFRETSWLRTRHKSLSMAWVDYQKAYDSVPHSWLLQCLQLHKISPILCKFLSCVMKSWRTSMVLSYGNSTIKTRLMQIRRSIFQGDSLSPLLFCMALNPLSKELNRTGYGYRMTTEHGETAKRQLISHLLYMDDLRYHHPHCQEDQSQSSRHLSQK